MMNRTPNFRRFPKTSGVGQRTHQLRLRMMAGSGANATRRHWSPSQPLPEIEEKQEAPPEVTEKSPTSAA